MQALWMRNFAVNMPIILQAKDISQLPRYDGEPCIVVGAGPSVKRFRQLEILAEAKWKHPIICADRMLIPLLKRKVKPKVVCTVDGNREIFKFYNSPIVEKAKNAVKAVFCANTVHPTVIKHCPLEKYFFISLWDNPLQTTSLTRTFHLMTGKTILEAHGNSGSCSWAIAYFMGCSPIGLLGLDYAYYTSNIKNTTYYKTFELLSGKDKSRLPSYYRRVKTWAGYRVLTDVMWLTYLQLFLPALERAKAETYNLSPLSIITSRKVKGLDLQEFIENFK
jgi:hypothetical protein